MSDLISTPSQTQSSVSNDAFEALIDLLASDGIDDSSPERAGGNVSLRDPSGKLDYDKIRTMFATQNGGAPGSPGEEKVRALSPTILHEDGDSEDEHHSQRSTPSTVPSRLHSMSPKPIQRPPAGHRRSSTFGNQPWASIHENAAKVETDVAPTVARQPLSLDELNAALVGAHEEVRSLRQQYDELQALVAKRLGTEIRDQAKPIVNTDKVAPDKDKAGVQGHPSALPSDVPTEIADLSENEAKRALSALASSLSLSLDAIGTMTGPSTLSAQQRLLLNPGRQHDVASITRALKFLGSVDELVWRRTSAPSGPRTLLPVFSEENIVALVSRLELWERAVRRSSRI